MVCAGKRGGAAGARRKQTKKLTAHDHQRPAAPPPHEHGPVRLTPPLHGPERHVAIFHDPKGVAQQKARFGPRKTAVAAALAQVEALPEDLLLFFVEGL